MSDAGALALAFTVARDRPGETVERRAGLSVPEIGHGELAQLGIDRRVVELGDG